MDTMDENVRDWLLELEVERKSEATRKTYRDAVTAYRRWCAANGYPDEISKEAVVKHLAACLANGGAATTTRLRHAALRQFSKWLAREEIIPEDPLLKIPPPKLDSKVVPVVSDDELRRLFAACRGKDFRDRRDEAILRLMAETGMRAGETVALTVGDVDLNRGLVTVRRGKGGKGRVVSIGPTTSVAIGRWLRLRRTHRLADTPALWLGAGGKGLGYHGLEGALQARARSAGIDGFHLHRLRHTAATRWLRHGGSEQGLMATAGWSSRAMIDRYTGASAAERAAEEAKKLALGEL
jgi:site-specific recombinase XerD